LYENLLKFYLKCDNTTAYNHYEIVIIVFILVKLHI